MGQLAAGTVLLTRYAWPSLWTLLGLLVGLPVLAFGGRAQRVNGVLEISGGALGRWAERTRWLPYGVQAITLGHVITGSSADLLARLRAHEHAHVRQYECWGPLFVPAYLVDSVWQWLRGGHAYLDNGFERAARRVEAQVEAQIFAPIFAPPHSGVVPAFHPLPSPPPGRGRE